MATPTKRQIFNLPLLPALERTSKASYGVTGDPGRGGQQGTRPCAGLWDKYTTESLRRESEIISACAVGIGDDASVQMQFLQLLRDLELKFPLRGNLPGGRSAPPVIGGGMAYQVRD
eukprot:1195326-Prorocentrum_minimum.AAC.11